MREASICRFQNQIELIRAVLDSSKLLSKRHTNFCENLLGIQVPKTENHLDEYTVITLAISVNEGTSPAFENKFAHSRIVVLFLHYFRN